MKLFNKQFSAIFALALVTFIDTLGLAILYPILSPLFMSHSSAGMISLNTTPEIRNLYYGLTLTLFPMATFFAAPILGDISDKIGRKKILLACLLGTFGSYLLAAIAIIYKTVFLFLASRVIAGLTAGSLPIAQAAIIDISDVNRKAYNLSFMILAISLGYACGPLISGIFSNQHFSSLFNLSTPLFLAAILSFANIIILVFSFHVVPKVNETISIKEFKFFKGVTELMTAFKHKKLRSLSFIYFILQLGWGFYFQFVSLFLVKKLLLNVTGVGIFMALIAIGFTITSLFLIRWIMKFLSMIHATAIALMAASIIFLITCLVDKSNFFVWLIPLFIGINIGVAYTFLITLFSNQVDKNEQGRIMGITTSITAITWVISSLLGSFLINFNISIPLFTSAILLVFSALFTFIYSYYNKQTQLQMNYSQ